MTKVKSVGLKRAGLSLLTFLVIVFATVSQCAAKTGNIRCLATPGEAVSAGVKWSIMGQEGGPYSFGDTISYTWSGGNTVPVTLTFSSEGRWNPSIPSQSVNITNGSTTSFTVGYTLGIDKSFWPLWPEKARVDRVLSPPSFLSVGRDVVSWVSVSMDVNFPSTNLYALIQKNENSFVYKPSPTTNLSDAIYYVSSADREAFPNNLNDLVEELRGSSVIKRYATSADWGVAYPNQDFGAWFTGSSWRTFSNGYISGNLVFADSGHAPPLPVYDEDNWLTRFVKPYLYGKYGVDYPIIPAAWKDKVMVFLPTNQGVLNTFQVVNTTAETTIKREWGIMPRPAFRQAPYHQAYYWNSYDTTPFYSRLTVLDGPVAVRDIFVDESGTKKWKRILIGTTGSGTKQKNKPASAWVKEGEGSAPSASPNEFADPGRIWGIYAIDVTDPLNPTSLWSVSNVFYDRVNETESDDVSFRVKDGITVSASNYADYKNVKFSVAKPLISFTKETNGSLTWHALVVGVNKNNQYCRLDINPETGEVYSSGYGLFYGQQPNSNGTGLNTAAYETLPLNSEDWENFYPTRVLSAYPKNAATYNNLPLLSDVYIYLSNGSFYKWDLQNGVTPQKLLAIVTQGYIAPPITDFDIAYFYVGSEIQSNLHTFLAATVPFDYTGASNHDTSGLLIVDLDRFSTTTLINAKGAQGQPGDTKAKLLESGVAAIQLQTSLYGDHGSNAADFNKTVASPIFLGFRLYQAVYSNETSNVPQVTRLYTLDMKAFSLSGSGNISLPPDAFIKDTNGQDLLKGKEAVVMTIDKDGYLVLFDEEGNQIYRSESPVVPTATGEGAGGGSSTPGIRIAYWKVR